MCGTHHPSALHGEQSINAQVSDALLHGIWGHMWPNGTIWGHVEPYGAMKPRNTGHKEEKC